MRPLIWVTAAALLLAGRVVAEQQKSNSQATPATQSEKKPALADAVRVSTDAALRNAAKEEVKKPATDKAKKDSPEVNVLEFHPTKSEPTASGGAVVVPKQSKGTPLKNIHGSVYGSTSGKNVESHSTGGSVGASTKSGKTSIYVEAERSRNTPPR